MPYLYTYFDDTPMPNAMQEDDLSTGQVESSLVDSIGGKFDFFGSTQRLPRSHQFSHKGKYVGEVLERVTSSGDTRVTDDGTVRVTAPSKVADLHGKTDDLKAKIGVLGQLWRQRIADGVLTWKRCRLLQVEHTEDVENANVVSEVQTTFETKDVGWRSAAAVTTSVSATAGITNALNVPNAGSMPARNATLRVARTSGTITAVQVTGTGIDFTWTGSIGASQTLVINTEDETVLIGTTDQYNGFVLNAGHTSDVWLPLPTGTVTLLVTLTGGNGNVSVEHYNQWP